VTSCLCREFVRLRERRGGGLAARDAVATAIFRGRGIRIFSFAFGSGRGELLAPASGSESGLSSESTDNGEVGIALFESSGVEASALITV
jgi:hypothetical protein